MDRSPGILVVDDEDSIVQITKQILIRRNYNVLTAVDGIEAIDIFRIHTGEIDLVILDLTMPIMDGADVYRELKAIRPDIPIVLTSGLNCEETIEAFGVSDYAGVLQKPVQMTTLLDTVQGILGS
jgi:CheY-like chemotaxis protein